MAVSPNLISELAYRAKAVAENPDNFYTKVETLVLIKQVKGLATEGDKMAQYQLAQLYPKNSSSYLTWMQSSAKQGFTNAMLALSRDFAESGTVSGIRMAAQYVVKILASDDSYIKTEAKALMERNRILGAEVARQMNNAGAAKSAFTLFAHEAKTAGNEQADLQNSIPTQAR